MKKVLTILTILIFSFNAKATHLIGGDFKVTMTNNGASSSNYDIQLRLYRDDVNGIVNMPSAVTIGIYQIGTNILESTKVLYLDNNTGSIIPLGDPCYSPDTLVVRVEEGVYNGLTSTVLPNFSMGYYIQYQTCCRNASVTNLADPDNDGISIFAIIPDPALGQNSSPDFGNYPNDAYFCLNSTNSFIWPVTDPDGDSLVFSLVQPLNDGNGATNGNSTSGTGAYPFYPTCIYAAGYSLTSLGLGTPPFTINSVTGEINCSPAMLGNFVFSVRVEEYRNGVKIGEVRRDVQYASNPGCSNNNVYSTDYQYACNSYTWLDGNTYYSNNNSATYIFSDTINCYDSIVTLDLIINNTLTNNIFENFCGGSYNFNGNILTSSGTYYDTLQTSSGCDSIIVLDLFPIFYYGIDTITSCNFYTWIDGITYSNSNYTATDTIMSLSGCDSVITLNLTILPNQFGTDFDASQLLFTFLPFVAQFTNTTPNITNYNFTWDFGDGTILQSNNANVFHDFLYNGLYSVTLIAEDINTGCTDTMYKQDYVYTTGGSCINAGIDIQNACVSYTWIDGNTYTSSNNTATDTLTNAAGCDSIVTLNLIINQTSSSIDNQILCDGSSLNWIDGNTYTSSNNTATDTLTNAAGCDSMVTLNLTVSSSTSGLLTLSSCNSYIYNGQTLTSSGVYVTIDTNAAGCLNYDSLDLTITTGATTTIQTSCNSFLWNGTTYNTSGTYTSNSGGNCVDTLILTVFEFLTGFTESATLFTSPPFVVQLTNTTANMSNFNFTWDFGDGIIQQNNNSSLFHEYLYNGLYDVSLIAEDLNNGCGLDTLKKQDLIYCSGGPSVSIIEVSKQINIYPNPTKEDVTISIENFNGNIHTEVYDLIGNRLQTTNETTISLQDYARGIYLLKVAYGDRVEEVKVIKD